MISKGFKTAVKTVSTFLGGVALATSAVASPITAVDLDGIGDPDALEFGGYLFAPVGEPLTRSALNLQTNILGVDGFSPVEAPRLADLFQQIAVQYGAPYSTPVPGFVSPDSDFVWTQEGMLYDFNANNLLTSPSPDYAANGIVAKSVGGGSVPEPGSLALVGLALAGLGTAGMVTRRRPGQSGANGPALGGGQ